ncbi:MAG: nucleotide excision repair endonuclease [Paraclostridium sp.]
MAFVYKFRHYRSKEVIYVGKTNRTVKKRMSEHFGGKGHLPKECYNKVGKIEYVEVPSDADALLVEQYLINKYKPKYNKNGKASDSQSLRFSIMMFFLTVGKWEVYEIRRTSFFLWSLFKIDHIGDLIFKCIMTSIVVIAVIESLK